MASSSTQPQEIHRTTFSVIFIYLNECCFINIDETVAFIMIKIAVKYHVVVRFISLIFFPRSFYTFAEDALSLRAVF